MSLNVLSLFSGIGGLELGLERAGMTTVGQVEIGYDLQWDCIPAAAIGAPHQRDRWFGVAYPSSHRLEGRPIFATKRGGNTPINPARSCGLLGGRWDLPEPRPWGVAHGVPARVDRTRVLGNAVVPQVAEHVGRLILAHAAERVAA